MLKFLLGFLLLANGVMQAYNAGLLGDASPTGREPARMANQLNVQRMRLEPVSPMSTEEPVDESGALSASFTYATDLFDPETIDRFVDRFLRIVATIGSFA